MDVTTSVKALSRITYWLRISAWLVFVAAAAAAIKLAFSVSFIPGTVPMWLENALPASGFIGGLAIVFYGALTCLCLLGFAEGLQMLMAIEANTRAAAAGNSAPAEKEKVAAGR